MSILEKPVKQLTAEDYAALEKPLGERVPYPAMGLGYIAGADGKKKLTRYLGVLKKPLIITSERSLDEVEGFLIRNMPTPEKLKSFFELMSAIHPRNRRRAIYVKGAPGTGKTYDGELAGAMVSEKGAVKIDCTNMNLNELFFETVLDFNTDKRFYDALNAKIEKYNRASSDGERDRVLNPLSVDIMREYLGDAFSDEDGKININWGKIKDAHSDGEGGRLETRACIEIAIDGLRKISAKEGLDSLGGNALGMATQEGPAWRAYKEGRVLILDELNRAKRGTFGVLHGWMQFVIGEIQECKVRNPLKEKGDHSKAFLHFKSGEMAAGHFVYMTGNTEDDSDEVLELPEALSSRVVPDPIAAQTVRGWQHRWCQALTGMPVSTLYYAQKDIWDKDKDAFGRKLLEWRVQEEKKAVPDYHLDMLRNWRGVLQASENLARFMDSAAKAINPDSEWHKAGTLTQLLDDISETLKKEMATDYRKIGYFFNKAFSQKPSVRPPQSDDGQEILPLIGDMDMPDDPADIKYKLGTHITYVIVDWIITNTFDRGKTALGNQLMQLARECGLIQTDFAEALKSGRPSVADLLDRDVFQESRGDNQARHARGVLSRYLRSVHPGIGGESDEEILPLSAVERAIENAGKKQAGLVVPETDPRSAGHNPLKRAGSVDMASPEGKPRHLPKMPAAESFVAQSALLASFAIPALRERNLTKIWNEALSATGLVNRGMDGLEDESLAIAENRSQSGVAITTVYVRRDDSAQRLPLHLIWNKKLDRVMAIGEGAVGKSLKQAFNDARIFYVDRNEAQSGETLRGGIDFVLGAETPVLRDKVKDAFLMRNRLATPEAETERRSLLALLSRKDLECYLPNCIVAGQKKPAVA